MVQPRQQRSRGRAYRHHGSMPEHHVRGLEIRAVKLQHGHSGQTRKCARHQSGGNEIHCKLLSD